MKIFHLSEPRHGWIEVTFGQQPDSYTLMASNVPNDCLRDLAAATVRLLKWSTDETVEFSLEPDFARCRLHRDSDSIGLAVSGPGNETPVFTDTYPLHAFAQRLRFELLRIQSRYSADDGWTQPFPHEEVNNLL